ncbi:MAG: hypothetical protein IT381_31680 [Deltaproteobacteria bacterium]|nr:hypothetical protein [Deltaproteobacteria bacterium]
MAGNGKVGEPPVAVVAKPGPGTGDTSPLKDRLASNGVYEIPDIRGRRLDDPQVEAALQRYLDKRPACGPLALQLKEEVRAEFPGLDPKQLETKMLEALKKHLTTRRPPADQPLLSTEKRDGAVVITAEKLQLETGPVAIERVLLPQAPQKVAPQGDGVDEKPARPTDKAEAPTVADTKARPSLTVALQPAIDALAAGDTDKAASLFAEALKGAETPEDRAALYRRAIVLCDKKKIGPETLEAALSKAQPKSDGNPATKELSSEAVFKQEFAKVKEEMAEAARTGKTPAELRMKYILGEALKKRPLEIMQKYGIDAESFEEWRRTGTPPAGYKQMLEEFMKTGNQKLYAPLIFMQSYGQDVAEFRKQQGLMKPDEAKETAKAFRTENQQVNAKWQQLNDAYTNQSGRNAKKATTDYDAAVAAGKSGPELDKLRAERDRWQTEYARAAKVMDDVADTQITRAGGIDKAPPDLLKRGQASSARVADAQGTLAGTKTGDMPATDLADPSKAPPPEADAAVAAIDKSKGINAVLVKRDPTALPWQRDRELVDLYTGGYEGAGTSYDAALQARMRASEDKKPKPPLSDDDKKLVGKQAGTAVKLNSTYHVDQALTRQEWDTGKINDEQYFQKMGALGPKMTKSDGDVRALMQAGRVSAAEKEYADAVVKKFQADQKENDKVVQSINDEIAETKKSIALLQARIGPSGGNVVEGLKRGELYTTVSELQDKLKKLQARLPYATKGQDDQYQRTEELKKKWDDAKKSGDDQKAGEYERQYNKAQARLQTGLADYDRNKAANDAAKQPPVGAAAFDEEQRKAISDAYASEYGVSGLDAQVADVDKRLRAGQAARKHAIDPGVIGVDGEPVLKGDALRQRQILAKGVDVEVLTIDVAFEKQESTRLGLQFDAKALNDPKYKYDLNRPDKKGDPVPYHPSVLTGVRPNSWSRGKTDADVAEADRKLRAYHIEYDTPDDVALYQGRLDDSRGQDRGIALRDKVPAMFPGGKSPSAELRTALTDLEGLYTSGWDDQKKKAPVAFTTGMTLAAGAGALSDSQPKFAADRFKTVKQITADVPVEQQPGYKAGTAAIANDALKGFNRSDDLDAGTAREGKDLTQAVTDLVMQPGVPPKIVDDFKAEQRKFEGSAALLELHLLELQEGAQDAKDRSSVAVYDENREDIENGGVLMGQLMGRLKRATSEGDEVEASKLRIEIATLRFSDASKKSFADFDKLPYEDKVAFVAIMRSKSPQYWRASSLVMAKLAPNNADATQIDQVWHSTHATRFFTTGSFKSFDQAVQLTKDARAKQIAIPKIDGSGTIMVTTFEADCAPDAHKELKSREDSLAKTKRYWANPMNRIGASLVDEAFLYVVTCGAYAAVSAARATAMMARLARMATTAARWAQEARGIGRVVSAGRWAFEAYEGAREAYQGVKMAMQMTRSGRAALTAGRFIYGVGHMKVIEVVQHGAHKIAARYYGDDHWITGATDVAGRFAVYAMGGPVPGLTAVENGAFGIGQMVVEEVVRDTWYKDDPIGWEKMQKRIALGGMFIQVGVGQWKEAHANQQAARQAADELAIHLVKSGVDVPPDFSARFVEMQARYQKVYGEGLPPKAAFEAHRAEVLKLFGDSANGKLAAEAYMGQQYHAAFMHDAGLSTVDWGHKDSVTAKELGARVDKAAKLMVELGLAKDIGEARLRVTQELKQDIAARAEARIDKLGDKPKANDPELQAMGAYQKQLADIALVGTGTKRVVDGLPEAARGGAAPIVDRAIVQHLGGDKAAPSREALIEQLRQSGLSEPGAAERAADRTLAFVAMRQAKLVEPPQVGTLTGRVAHEKAMIALGVAADTARALALEQHGTEIGNAYRGGFEDAALGGKVADIVARQVAAVEGTQVTPEGLKAYREALEKALRDPTGPNLDEGSARAIAQGEVARLIRQEAPLGIAFDANESAAATAKKYLDAHEKWIAGAGVEPDQAAVLRSSIATEAILRASADQTKPGETLADKRTHWRQAAEALGLSTGYADQMVFSEAVLKTRQQVEQTPGFEGLPPQKRTELFEQKLQEVLEKDAKVPPQEAQAMIARAKQTKGEAVEPPKAQPLPQAPANKPANAPTATRLDDAQIAAKAAPTPAEIGAWMPHEPTAQKMAQAFAVAKRQNNVEMLRVLHGIVELAKTDPAAARTATQLILSPHGALFQRKLAALVARGDAAYTASVVAMLGGIYAEWGSTTHPGLKQRITHALDHLTAEPPPKNFEAVRAALAHADVVGAVDPAHAARLRQDVLGMVAARREERLAADAQGRTDDAATRGSNFRFENDHLPEHHDWPTHMTTVRVGDRDVLVPVTLKRPGEFTPQGGFGTHTTVEVKIHLPPDAEHPQGRTETRTVEVGKLQTLERPPELSERLQAGENHTGAQPKQGYVLARSGSRELVWNVSERRFELVEKGAFRPTAHGQQAVGLLDSEAHRKTEQIRSDIDAFRSKLPAGEQAMLDQEMFTSFISREEYGRLSEPAQKSVREQFLRAKLDEVLSSANTPEEQAILVKTFAERGSFADVERVQTMLKAYFGDEVPTPQALQRLTTGDGIRQLYEATCGPTDVQLVQIAASPLEALRVVSLGREGLIEEQTAMMKEINAGTDLRTAGDVAFVPGMGDRVAAHGPAYDPDVVVRDPRQWGSYPEQMQYWLNLRVGARQGTSYESVAIARDGRGFPKADRLSATEARIWDQFSPPGRTPSEGVVLGVSWVTEANGQQSVGSGHWIQITRAYERGGERIYVVRDPWTGETKELSARELFNPAGGSILGGKGVVTSAMLREPPEITRGRDALGRGNYFAGNAFADAYTQARALEADPSPGRRIEGKARRELLDAIAAQRDPHVAQEALLALQRFAPGDVRMGVLVRALAPGVPAATRGPILAAFRMIHEQALVAPGKLPPEFHDRVMNALLAGHLTPEQAVNAAQMLAWEHMPANQRAWFQDQWTGCRAPEDYARVLTQTSDLLVQARASAAAQTPPPTPPPSPLPGAAPGLSPRMPLVDEPTARAQVDRVGRFETGAKATPGADNPPGQKKTVLEPQPGDTSLSRTYATPTDGVGAKVAIGEQVVVESIPPGQKFSLSSHGFNSCAACVIKATRADGSTVVVFSHITGQNSTKTQMQHVQDALAAARAAPPPDPNMRFEVFLSIDPAAGSGASLPRQLDGTAADGSTVRFAGNLPVDVELVPGTTDRYRVRDASELKMQLGPGVDLHVDVAAVKPDGKPVERNVFVTEHGIVVEQPKPNGEPSELRAVGWASPADAGYGGSPVDPAVARRADQLRTRTERLDAAGVGAQAKPLLDALPEEARLVAVDRILARGGDARAAISELQAAYTAHPRETVASLISGMPVKPLAAPLGKALTPARGNAVHLVTVSGTPMAVHVLAANADGVAVAAAARSVRAQQIVQLPDGRLGVLTEAVPLVPMSAGRHLNSDVTLANVARAIEELRAAGRDIAPEHLIINSAGQVSYDPAHVVAFNPSAPKIDLGKTLRALREASFGSVARSDQPPANVASELAAAKFDKGVCTSPAWAKGLREAQVKAVKEQLDAIVAEKRLAGVSIAVDATGPRVWVLDTTTTADGWQWTARAVSADGKLTGAANPMNAPELRTATPEQLLRDLRLGEPWTRQLTAKQRESLSDALAGATPGAPVKVTALEGDQIAMGQSKPDGSGAAQTPVQIRVIGKEGGVSSHPIFGAGSSTPIVFTERFRSSDGRREGAGPGKSAARPALVSVEASLVAPIAPGTVAATGAKLDEVIAKHLQVGDVAAVQSELAGKLIPDLSGGYWYNHVEEMAQTRAYLVRLAADFSARKNAAASGSPERAYFERLQQRATSAIDYIDTVLPPHVRGAGDRVAFAPLSSTSEWSRETFGKGGGALDADLAKIRAKTPQDYAAAVRATLAHPGYKASLEAAAAKWAGKTVASPADVRAFIEQRVGALMERTARQLVEAHSPNAASDAKQAMADAIVLKWAAAEYPAVKKLYDAGASDPNRVINAHIIDALVLEAVTGKKQPVTEAIRKQLASDPQALARFEGQAKAVREALREPASSPLPGAAAPHAGGSGPPSSRRAPDTVPADTVPADTVPADTLPQGPTSFALEPPVPPPPLDKMKALSLDLRTDFRVAWDHPHADRAMLERVLAWPNQKAMAAFIAQYNRTPEMHLVKLNELIRTREALLAKGDVKASAELSMFVKAADRFADHDGYAAFVDRLQAAQRDPARRAEYDAHLSILEAPRELAERAFALLGVAGPKITLEALKGPYPLERLTMLSGIYLAKTGHPRADLISPKLLQTLDAAITTPRSKEPGALPRMSPQEAVRLTETLLAMDKLQVKAFVEACKGKSPEQVVLMLKMVAARGDKLADRTVPKSGGMAPADRALAEIMEYSAWLSTQTPDSLAGATDLNGYRPTVVSIKDDSGRIIEERLVLEGGAGEQVYKKSCAATTAIMAAAEADPYIAYLFKKDPAKMFEAQRKLMYEQGVAFDRRDNFVPGEYSLAKAIIDAQALRIDSVLKDGSVKPEEQKALADWSSKRHNPDALKPGSPEAAAMKTLEQLYARLTPAQKQRLAEEGILNARDFLATLSLRDGDTVSDGTHLGRQLAYAESRTGLCYSERYAGPDDIDLKTPRGIAELEAAVRRYGHVPIVVGWDNASSHAMMLKGPVTWGEPPKKCFLISDPWHAKAVAVPVEDIGKADVVRGLGIGKGSISTLYIPHPREDGDAAAPRKSLFADPALALSIGAPPRTVRMEDQPFEALDTGPLSQRRGATGTQKGNEPGAVPGGYGGPPTSAGAQAPLFDPLRPPPEHRAPVAAKAVDDKPSAQWLEGLSKADQDAISSVMKAAVSSYRGLVASEGGTPAKTYPKAEQRVAAVLSEYLRNASIKPGSVELMALARQLFKVAERSPTRLASLDAYLTLPAEQRQAGGQALLMMALNDLGATPKKIEAWGALIASKPDVERKALLMTLGAFYMSARGVASRLETITGGRTGDTPTPRELGAQQRAVAGRLEFERVMLDSMFAQAQAGPLSAPFVPAARFSETLGAIQTAYAGEGAFLAAGRLLADARTPVEQEALFALIRAQAAAGLPFHEKVLRDAMQALRSKHPELLVAKGTAAGEDARRAQLWGLLTAKPPAFELRGPPPTATRIERDFTKELRAQMATTDPVDRRLPEPDATNAALLFGLLQPDAPKDGSAPSPVLISRAGIEKIFTPALEGYSAEVVSFSCLTSDQLSFEVVIRGPEPDRVQVGKVRRTGLLVDDGQGGHKLRWENEVFTLSPDHQGLGIAEDIYAQQAAFFKVYAPKTDTEIVLTANISIGVYAWARKGFKFATDEHSVAMRWTPRERGSVVELARRYPQLYPDGSAPEQLGDAKVAQRNIMVQEIYTFAESLREKYPDVFTDKALSDLRAQLRLCKDPADFSELRLRDGTGREIRLTVLPTADAVAAENARLDALVVAGKLKPKDRPFVIEHPAATNGDFKIDNKRFGSPAMLLGAMSWYGVSRPNEPPQAPDVRTPPRASLRPPAGIGTRQ